jgi:hypothetical protein
MLEFLLQFIDYIQYSVWGMAWSMPTDGMMDWYLHVNALLNNVECHLAPFWCE